MNKAVFIAAALLLTPLASWSQEVQDNKDRESFYAGKSATPSEKAGDQPQSAFRDRVTQAIETVEDACAADFSDFCARVTPGRGRIALCMRAHEDQLSGGCRLALYQVARGLKSSVDRVAETCWNEIQRLCGDADKLGQCLEQKKDSLSPACQSIVGTLRQRVHRVMTLVGMPVYSFDNKALGQVVEVVKGPGDEIQSIQVDIGRILGLGTKVVTITADKFDRLPGIRLRLSDTEVRSLPEAKKQNTP